MSGARVGSLVDACVGWKLELEVQDIGCSRGDFVEVAITIRRAIRCLVMLSTSGLFMVTLPGCVAQPPKLSAAAICRSDWPPASYPNAYEQCIKRAQQETGGGSNP